MQSIQSEPIDISILRSLAERIAEEPDTFTAFAMWFANAPLESLDAAREFAEQQINEHPLQHLFQRTTLDGDGRTVYKSGSGSDRGGIPADTWAEMVRHLGMKIGLMAQGYIWPALLSFSTERKLSLEDFAVMVRASAFVPPDQERHFAKAIYNGYYGRLSESIFMLAPTMEACVRACLQRAGVETRNIRSDNTEIEPGLSALMELDGVNEALSPELAWHIRALYCGPLGPNLRNRVAHGLVTDAESGGPNALFAWWLAFRLAFVPFFNLITSQADQTEDGSGGDPRQD